MPCNRWSDRCNMKCIPCVTGASVNVGNLRLVVAMGRLACPSVSQAERTQDGSEQYVDMYKREYVLPAGLVCHHLQGENDRLNLKH